MARKAPKRAARATAEFKPRAAEDEVEVPISPDVPVAPAEPSAPKEPPKGPPAKPPAPLEGQTWQRMNADGEVDNVRVIQANPGKVLVEDLATGNLHKVDPERFRPEHGWRLYAHGRTG